MPPQAERPPIVRILLVEDNHARAWQIKQWLPSDVRVVHATDAGTAIGIVTRDAGHVYAGVMLDFDLDRGGGAGASRRFNGGDVAEAICQHFSPDIPILVHSMNPTGGAKMVGRLEGRGFDVTRLRMCFLDPVRLGKWVAEAREIWEASQA